MEKRVLNFSEYRSEKSQGTLTEYRSEKSQGALNEGIVDSIMNFFKGIFDLFSDKKVKEAAENQSKRFKEIEDDDDIEDDEVEDEIDAKRTRKTNDNMYSSIKERIKINVKDGVKSSKMLNDELASWFGMIIVQQESLRMPIIEKMLKDPELSKKFVWVPLKWSTPGSKVSIKTWYSSKECIVDKTVANAILTAAKATQKDKKAAITKLANIYLNNLVQKGTPEEKAKNTTLFKKNDPAYLSNLLNGCASMANNVLIIMNQIVSKTPDDKLKEIIAKDIIDVRTRRKKESPKKDEKKKDTSHPDDEEAGSDRTGRRLKTTKKEATTAPKKETKKEATV